MSENTHHIFLKPNVKKSLELKDFSLLSHKKRKTANPCNARTTECLA